MDNPLQILSSIPLFRHLNSLEINRLYKEAGHAEVKTGSGFNLAKTGTFNVVIKGLLEIESSGKTDIVYMAPGSFFGHIPFAMNRHRGSVSALIDSVLLVFKPEAIYRFFLSNYQAYRGYLNILKKLNFEVPKGPDETAKDSSKIVCFYSIAEGAGKSTAAIIFSKAASEKGRTVLLDMSYSGKSVFNFFNARITTPISYRDSELQITEESVKERIVATDNGPDLMNIAYGSKVRVSPEILSPLIYILSQIYDTIVLDLGSSDHELAVSAYLLSDFLICVVKEASDISSYHDYNDRTITGMRSIFYLINEKFSGTKNRITGGYILESITDGLFIAENLSNNVEYLKPITERIFKKRRALVIESGWKQAIMASGIFGALLENPDKIDVIYTSTLSYLIAAIYLKARDIKDFRNIIGNLLGENKITAFFDYVFPEENVFKSDPLKKISREIFSDTRSESFRIDTPLKLMPVNSSEPEIITAGKISDLIPAALSFYPVFEPVSIKKGIFHSGYPETAVQIEEVYRGRVDESVFVSTANQYKQIHISGAPKIFSSFLSMYDSNGTGKTNVQFYDHEIRLDFSEKNLNIEKIFDLSYDQSIKCLKEKGVI